MLFGRAACVENCRGNRLTSRARRNSTRKRQWVEADEPRQYPAAVQNFPVWRSIFPTVDHRVRYATHLPKLGRDPNGLA